MSLGLVGRKVGMMRIFKDDGTSVPVTVLDCSGNRVTQIKSKDTDGYVAIQVAFGKRRASRVSKAMAGHYSKAGVEAASEMRESRAPPDPIGERKVESEQKVDLSRPGMRVVVPGTPHGRGF